VKHLLHFASLISVGIVQREIMRLHIHSHLVVRWVDLGVIPLEPFEVKFVSLLLVDLLKNISHVLCVALPQQSLIVASQ